MQRRAVYKEMFCSALCTWETSSRSGENLGEILKIRRPVCQSLFLILRLLEEEVGSQFLILVAGEVGLDGLVPGES